MREALPRPRGGLSLVVLGLLLVGCADSVAEPPVAETKAYHPPPFNRTVSWYDDYTMSVHACWRIDPEPPPYCP